MNSVDVDRLFRENSARAVAQLARYFNDFDRAEDALQDAYVIALASWPVKGVPRHPQAWIARVARNSAIDHLRRESVANQKYEQLARDLSETTIDEEEGMDDRLGMIFAACHPTLNLDTRIALTLRFAAGLAVDEIAAALLTTSPTIAQRLVRAKRKIRQEQMPFAVPQDSDLPARLGDVLRVVYLIFNEGYAASCGERRMRVELCREALRLVAMLEELLPNEPEIMALHALMLFHDARQASRVDEHGDMILLEDQDRSRWDASVILEGLRLLDAAARHYVPGTYQLQAAIAAEHARARSWEATDWARIRRMYDALIALEPSPIAQLSRAIAIAYHEGFEVGLRAVDALENDPRLREHRSLHLTRGDLLRRLQRVDEARDAYQRALQYGGSSSETRFIESRLEQLQ